MRRVTLYVALLLCVPLVGGCNILSYFLYLIAPPPPKKTIKAECDELRGAKVAVLVYASMNTLFEYPHTREELGHAVSKELRENVRGLTVLDPMAVVRYQDANLHWNSLPVDEVGRALEVDYVLYIALGQFSTRAPGSLDLPQGRIGGQASVWDTQAAAAGEEPCRWHKNNVAVTQDSHSGPLSQNDRALRAVTERVFAVKLAKYFYDHKESPGP